MHVPDGMLSTPVWTACAVAGGASVAAAVARANRRLDERHVPLLGVSGAFVFAAQMLKFPIGGGTSGHFLGGALVGILLGPASAIVVLSSVLLIQCFVFQDGGVTALGANLVNMGLLGGVLGAGAGALARRIAPPGPDRRARLRKALIVAGLVAGWASTFLGALACAGELALSGTIPASVVVPAMGGVHAVIGIGEGIVTAMALSLLATVRPDLLELERL